MPLPLGVNGGIVPCCEIELFDVTPDEIGLIPSVELLLGGVRRFPTLVSDVEVGVG